MNYNPYLSVFSRNYENGFEYGTDYTNSSIDSQAFMALKCAFNFDGPCAAYMIGSDCSMPGRSVLYGMNAKQYVSQPEAFVRNMAAYKYGNQVPGCNLKSRLMDPQMDSPMNYYWYPANSDPTACCIPNYKVSSDQIADIIHDKDPVMKLMLQEPLRYRDILMKIIQTSPEVAEIIKKKCGANL